MCLAVLLGTWSGKSTTVSDVKMKAMKILVILTVFLVGTSFVYCDEEAVDAKEVEGEFDVNDMR